MNERLLLNIKDSRLLVKVINRLKFRSVSFTLQRSGREDIVMTDDPSSIKSGNLHVVYVTHDNYEGRCELVKLLIRGKLVYNEVRIGIDPGDPHTIAIMGNGELIEVFRSDNVEQILHKILLIHKTYPYKNIVIKVGCGGGYEPILKHLCCNLLGLDNVRVEVVDESGTSRRLVKNVKGLRIAKRDYAAINIAMKRGVEVDKKSW